MKGLEEVRERLGRGLRGVWKGFGRCLERFGRGKERNGLVIREEIGQLGKQLMERKIEKKKKKKVVSRSRQRLFAT